MKKFVINIDDKLIDDLKYRLDRVRWPDEIPGSGWKHGTNLEYLKVYCIKLFLTVQQCYLELQHI